MNWRDERGQAFSEYMMIAGLLTAITVVVLGLTFGQARRLLRAVADCVRTDECHALEKPLFLPPPPPVPMPIVEPPLDECLLGRASFATGSSYTVSASSSSTSEAPLLMCRPKPIECANCGSCEKCETSVGICIADLAKDVSTCDDKNSCTKGDMCRGGTCNGNEPNMKVSGSTSDKQAFQKLLQKCGSLDGIGAYCSMSISATVGRQMQVALDSFATGAIDLDDFDALATPACKNASDQCQNLVHVLAEREHAAKDGCTKPADPCFTKAHNAGIKAENTYRKAMGLATYLKASPACKEGICLQYSDGTEEVWELDANLNIKKRWCR